MEIAQTIDKALYDYYSEQGKPVPQWKTKKNPDWWEDYLNSLGIDPRNPQCTEKNTSMKKMLSVVNSGTDGMRCF